MSSKDWKKTSAARTVDEFLIEKTGLNAAQLTAVMPNYRVYRIPEAATMLNQARIRNQKISLVADYDSDGINSALIMYNIFMANGNRFELIMPKRESEGYGLSDKIMDRIDPHNMLITIDNGIKAVEQIKRAKAQGMEVLILDHHEAGDEIPPADVVIDPAAIGEADFIYYCGAGLAYKLAEYMFGENSDFVNYLSAYAAIGTIGDCVNLTGDNRKIVQKGIQALKHANCASSLCYLWDNSKMSESSTAMDIAFNIVPALNAPGRLYDDGAKIPVSVLFKSGELNDNIKYGVNQLLKINQERKKLVEQYTSKLDYDGIIEKGEKGVILYDPGIPLGIAGIIAGNISEHTGRPAIVFSKDPSGLLKGSARNPDERINIIEILSSLEYLLAASGGHKKAAGLSIEEENLEEFKYRFLNLLPVPEIQTGITYDLEIPEGQVLTEALQILALEPCGEGVPAPTVRIKARLIPQKDGTIYRLLGEKQQHVKFSCDGFDAIAFYQAEKIADMDGPFRYIDMVGRITLNIFRDKKTVQIIVDDFDLY